ncbi:enoyl-CoA hydratase-related protein [Arenibacterium sp. CAU 1754]
MTTRHLDTGTDELLCHVADHVATISLNNPAKRNALSNDITAGLERMLAETEADPDVRVLVLTGTNGAFCAGGDIGGMGDTLAGGGAPDIATMVERLRAAQNAISLKLYHFPKPTIAALPGPAAGAGMSIALACDLRIASQSAFLAPAFGKIALSGDFGGTWYLSRLIGPGRAKEVYYTSRRIDAQEGTDLGLFNRVVTDAALEQETAAFAGEIAAGPPVALAYMKANHNTAAVANLQTTLDMEADHMIRAMLSEDHKAAARAFLEKKPVVFNGS